MIPIKQILSEKRKPLAFVAPGDTVLSAARLMCDRDIGAVMVIENNQIIGMFTERDCLQKVTSLGLDPGIVLVRDVMTERVRYVTPDMNVSQCLALMTERYFRHLPVLDERKQIAGIVSIGDLVKAKMSEQEFEIEQLEHYIHA
jgi:CBS domain-containing protein